MKGKEQHLGASERAAQKGFFFPPFFLALKLVQFWL